MVAKIESGKSIIGALNYNERKVKAGKAKLIMAQLYPKESRFLNFDDKLFRLTDLAARNARAKTNTVHLSLNFDLTENLNEEKLCQIAEAYMEKIGFGQQPFLAYQHFDAGHNHIHILTTNIDADGTRISLHNIGKLKSEPARKAIEQEYGLVKAEDQARSIANQKNAKPLIYGATDTKRAISNIVSHVSQAYKFTSLAEFNAVLAGYNVVADRGPKATVMFEHGGLRYWALDDQGNKTGVPQKASSLYKKPTLKLLGERFKLNEYLKYFINVYYICLVSCQFLTLLIIILTSLSKELKNIKAFRRLFYIIFIIFSTVITPPDILSQIFICSILILTYEITIFLKKIKTSMVTN